MLKSCTLESTCKYQGIKDERQNLQRVPVAPFGGFLYRWAKGSIQTAKKNLGSLFKSDVSVLVKIQAFLHLTHYMVHPMMLLVVLTSIPMLYTQWFFNHLAHAVMIYTLLCLATFGPTSMYLFLSKYLVSPFLMICTAGFFSVFFLSIKQSFAKTRNPKKV